MTTNHPTEHINAGSRHPNLYRALTHAAQLADAAAIEEGLPPLLIELVKVRVSQVNNCAFCLRLHSQDALDKGEDPARLAMLTAWRGSGYYDEQERCALALAEYLTLIQDSHRNTGLYQSAVTHLTSGQVSALTWITVTTNTYNRIAVSGAYPVVP